MARHSLIHSSVGVWLMLRTAFVGVCVGLAACGGERVEGENGFALRGGLIWRAPRGDGFVLASKDNGNECGLQRAPIDCDTLEDGLRSVGWPEGFTVVDFGAGSLIWGGLRLIDPRPEPMPSTVDVSSNSGFAKCVFDTTWQEGGLDEVVLHFPEDDGVDTARVTSDDPRALFDFELPLCRFDM